MSQVRQQSLFLSRSQLKRAVLDSVYTYTSRRVERDFDLLLTFLKGRYRSVPVSELARIVGPLAKRLHFSRNVCRFSTVGSSGDSRQGKMVNSMSPKELSEDSDSDSLIKELQSRLNKLTKPIMVSVSTSVGTNDSMSDLESLIATRDVSTQTESDASIGSLPLSSVKKVVVKNNKKKNKSDLDSREVSRNKKQHGLNLATSLDLFKNSTSFISAGCEACAGKHGLAQCDICDGISVELPCHCKSVCDHPKHTCRVISPVEHTCYQTSKPIPHQKNWHKSSASMLRQSRNRYKKTKEINVDNIIKAVNTQTAITLGSFVTRLEDMLKPSISQQKMSIYKSFIVDGKITAIEDCKSAMDKLNTSLALPDGSVVVTKPSFPREQYPLLYTPSSPEFDPRDFMVTVHYDLNVLTVKETLSKFVDFFLKVIRPRGMGYVKNENAFSSTYTMKQGWRTSIKNDAFNDAYTTVENFNEAGLGTANPTFMGTTIPGFGRTGVLNKNSLFNAHNKTHQITETYVSGETSQQWKFTSTQGLIADIALSTNQVYRYTGTSGSMRVSVFDLINEVPITAINLPNRKHIALVSEEQRSVALLESASVLHYASRKYGLKPGSISEIKDQLISNKNFMTYLHNQENNTPSPFDDLESAVLDFETIKKRVIAEKVSVELPLSIVEEVATKSSFSFNPLSLVKKVPNPIKIFDWYSKAPTYSVIEYNALSNQTALRSVSDIFGATLLFVYYTVHQVKINYSESKDPVHLTSLPLSTYACKYPVYWLLIVALRNVPEQSRQSVLSLFKTHLYDPASIVESLSIFLKQPEEDYYEPPTIEYAAICEVGFNFTTKKLRDVKNGLTVEMEYGSISPFDLPEESCLRKVYVSSTGVSSDVPFDPVLDSTESRIDDIYDGDLYYMGHVHKVFFIVNSDEVVCAAIRLSGLTKGATVKEMPVIQFTNLHGKVEVLLPGCVDFARDTLIWKSTRPSRLASLLVHSDYRCDKPVHFVVHYCRSMLPQSTTDEATVVVNSSSLMALSIVDDITKHRS